MGKAVWAHVYRIGLTKESRKCGECVTEKALHAHRHAGTCVAGACVDFNRTRPTRHEGVHHVSHATIRKKNRPKPDSGASQSSGAPGA